MRSFNVYAEVWEGRKADDTADLCVYLLRCVLHKSSVVEKQQLIVFFSFFRVGKWVSEWHENKYLSEHSTWVLRDKVRQSIEVVKAMTVVIAMNFH